MGKIYYLDGAKNVARMLIDQIDIFTLENNFDEASKKVYDPKFELFVFEDGRRRSLYGPSSIMDNFGKSPSDN